MCIRDRACYESGGHFRHLYSLYEAGELTSAINRIIELSLIHICTWTMRNTRQAAISL